MRIRGIRIAGSNVRCAGFALALALAALAPVAFAEVKEDTRALAKAVGAGQVQAAQELIGKLVEAGGAQALDGVLDLVERIPPGHDELYWLLVEGAASFQDQPAMDALGTYVVRNKSKAVARDLLFALQNNPVPASVSVHKRVIEDGADDMAALSLDVLAGIRAVEAVDALVEALERYEKGGQDRLRLQAARSISALTGKTLGERAGPWKVWWAANRAKGIPEPVQGEDGGTSGTGTVIDRLDPVRGTSFAGLKENPPERIIVVIGKDVDADRLHTMDSIQGLLDQMGLPHKVVAKEELEDPKFDLSNTMAVLFNCILWKEHCVCPKCQPTGATTMRMQTCGGCDIHDQREYKLSNAALERLKAWVGGGGYLFTEDWNLEEIVERAWPDKVKHGDYLEEDHVKVEAARGLSAHPYLRRIFTPERSPDAGQGSTFESPLNAADHEWKIDKDTPSASIKDARGVQVLLHSDALAAKAKGNGSVALTFLYAEKGRQVTGGRGGSEWAPGGRVLHVLSHFGKQQSLEDAMSLQNLLVNYLLEAQERWIEK